MKPETGGPRIGPNVVAACPFISSPSPSHTDTSQTHHENRHAPPPRNRIMPHIRTYPPNDTNRTTPTNPHKQPKHHQRPKIRRKSRRDRENREDGE